MLSHLELKSDCKNSLLFAALQGCLDLYDNFESKSALGLDKLSFILTRPEDLKLLDHCFDPVQRLRRT